MYLLIADVVHVLKISTVTLEDRSTYFSEPDVNLWTKSTICVHNVPRHISEEEILLKFESRKTWGRELDVSQVIPDRPNRVMYVTYKKERGEKMQLNLQVYTSGINRKENHVKTKACLIYQQLILEDNVLDTLIMFYLASWLIVHLYKIIQMYQH